MNNGPQMFSSTSWNSKCPSFRSPNQDVLQTVSTTARYDLRRLQGCHVGWFGGIGADFQVERVCLRLIKNRSWWHHNSVGTTFPLQLWRYDEFEFVWRPLQLRQWYGEIQSQLPVFEMWPVVETCWDAAQTWTEQYGEGYLIHRCAGHSMTDATRFLENTVEATTIVQNFVLLLVEKVVWKKYIRNNKTDIKKNNNNNK